MGTARTIRVLLDSNQYAQDIARMEEEGFEDFYGYFNLVIRRHAKQNNFKAVLSTIRTLMNRPEDAIIPTWLHDLFLGYGDPSSSQFFRLPSRLHRLDLRDTFIDVRHLLEAFPPVSSSSSSPSAFVKKVTLDERLESLLKKKKKKREEKQEVSLEDEKRKQKTIHRENTTEEEERDARTEERKEEEEKEREEEEEEDIEISSSSSSLRVPIVLELQDAAEGEKESSVETAEEEEKEKGEKGKQKRENKKDEKVSRVSSSSWVPQIIRASSYSLPSRGPYLECERNVNQIR